MKLQHTRRKINILITLQDLNITYMTEFRCILTPKPWLAPGVKIKESFVTNEPFPLSLCFLKIYVHVSCYMSCSVEWQFLDGRIFWWTTRRKGRHVHRENNETMDIIFSSDKQIKGKSHDVGESGKKRPLRFNGKQQTEMKCAKMGDWYRNCGKQ